MIPAANAPLTMSSLEIAELTGKRHADVMRDVRSMLIQLLGDERKFASVYNDAKGEQRPCFNLPKRECLILVSGYDIKLRARIIDRWQELEERAAAPGAGDRSLRPEGAPRLSRDEHAGSRPGERAARNRRAEGGGARPGTLAPPWRLCSGDLAQMWHF